MSKRYKEIEGLSESQLLLLSFAAYKCTPLKADDIKALAQKHPVIEDYTSDMRVLIERGLYITGQGINKPILLKHIFYVLEEHTGWPKMFRDEGFTQGPFFETLWILSFRALSGEMMDLSREIASPGQILQLIEPLVVEERYYPILDSVAGRDFIQCAENQVQKRFGRDMLTVAHLDNLASHLETYAVHKHTSVQNRFYLKDEMAFYRYCLSGERVQKPHVRTTFDSYISAIELLYKGKHEESAEAFRQAMDRTMSMKDVPQNILASYFFVVTLHYDSRQNVKLEAISKSRDAAPVIQLLAGMKMMDKDELGDRIRKLVKVSGPMEQQILFLISRWSNLNNIQGFNSLEEPPQTAIMQLECAPYLKMDADAHQKLVDTFGEDSRMAQIKPVNDWSQTLQSLEQALSPKQASGSRVKFIFSGESIVGLREQRACEDGSWGNEKLLSYSQYLDGRYSFIDETDQKIIQVLRDFGKYSVHPVYRSEAEAILPFLVGSDRVYNMEGPMQISAGRAKVTFDIKVDKIVPKANVDSDNKGNVFARKVIIDDKGNATIIALDNQQRRILEMLLKQSGLPLSAAASIIDLSGQMQQFIDIDVSALKGLTEAVSLPGTGMIIVQIKPDKGSYMIEWKAMPYEGGARFDPADGPAEYIEHDSVGRAYKVQRDFQKEQDNLNDLTDFITKTPSYSMYSTKKLEIHQTENLLPLLEFLHDRPDDYAMEWPEGTEIKFKGKAGSSNWEIGLSAGINWFEMEGNLNLGNTQIPLKKVLEADLEGDSEFVLIGENEYLKISRALKRQLAALQNLGVGTNVQIPKYQVGKLAEVLGMGDLPVATGQEYQEQLTKMQEAYELEPAVPTGLDATLRPYQLDGYQWISRLAHWGAGGCLADDMGLGKTVQTIAFLLDRAAEGPSLVLAPTSVVPNWESEIRKFAPDLRPLLINSVKDRATLVNNVGPNDVVLCSYGVLVNSAEDIQLREWNVICLDEAHQIKNRWTKVSHAAMELRSKARIILTGTPVQNSLSDLWNLFQFINPGMLGRFEQFKARFYSADPKEADEKLEKLKNLTQPFILRRTKEEVLKELPQKTEIDYVLKMSDVELAEYEKMRVEIENDIASGGKEDVEISFFEGLTRLRMACCSFELQRPEWEYGSSKLAELKYILQHIYSPDSHILIFSQFTSFLSLAKKVLKDLGLPFFYLDGGTPLEQRAELVQQFQNGECPVFLISLKAGGLGLNLTAANYVILLDPWWNPSIEEQAIDRAYRIGQTQDVTVIRLIAEHTIEQKIVKLQDRKRGISDNILKGTGASNKLTYEEIMEMVSPFK